MANDVSSLFPQYWSRRQQIQLKKTLVSKEIASFEAMAELPDWNIVSRPYSDDNWVDEYVIWTDLSVQAIISHNENLEVNISKWNAVYIDKFEDKQSKYNIYNDRIDRNAYILRDEMDWRFFKEILNANLTLDDWDNWWSAWNPISLTKTNAFEAFTAAWAKLASNSVESDKPWVAVISPITAGIISESIKSSWFNLADYALQNWWMKDKGIAWWRVYVSTNVLHSYKLTYSGQPTANDTILVNGVTFTFVSSVWSTAGNVLIWADADTTYANLVNAINWWTGSWTTYIAVSTDNRRKFTQKNHTATQVSWSITVYWAWTFIMSENAGNATLSSIKESCYLGKQWSTDMVVQQYPTAQMNKAQLRNWYFLINTNLYWLKTFKEWKERLIKFDVKWTILGG